MAQPILALGAIFVMVACLFLIPLGFPGTWVMLAVLGIGAWLGEVAWWVWGILIGLAGLAEVAEFLIVRRASQQFGASRKAFWGAILGGIVGVLIGLPIPLPLAGPLIGGLVGTFGGAAVVTWWETKHMKTAGRAAFGALVGRAFAAAAKTAVGFAVLIIGAASLLLR
jgi:uncharacterized protein YqgC (DUF456 family)